MDDLPDASDQARQQAKSRQASLTKPAGSLGRLEDIAVFFAGWQGNRPFYERPSCDQATCHVFAGNHGVTTQGVSAFPSNVTHQMVENFQNGGAAINQICKAFDIDLKVTEINLDDPTADFTQQPAMSIEEMEEAFSIGALQLDANSDVVLIGEMGIGNTTSAAAICYALFGGTAADWVGRGTGVDDEGLNRKTAVLEKARSLHQSAIADDPLAVLQHLGGREIAAICGLIVAARMQSIPVILDGFVTAAAVAVLRALNPIALDHCLTGHVSAEAAHKKVLERINQQPLLDLNMRLGEASGAATAFGLIKAALITHNQMATFEEAAISGKENG